MSNMGFVLLDKDKDMTSFFAASRLKSIFGEKKVGHTGTLDPLATGVLVCALGKATKFIPYLKTGDKLYKAIFRLGMVTDTLDITGTVTEKTGKTASCEMVKTALDSFLGESMQEPPMFSAIKQNGKKLYSIARAGQTVEREKRPILIKKIALENALSENEFEITVLCSAGTYIRSLVFDVGQMLGTGAVLTSLRREAANGASIKNCHTLSELRDLKSNNNEQSALKKIEDMLCFDSVFVSEKQALRFKNGGELSKNRLDGVSGEGIFKVFSNQNEFLGLGKADEKDLKVLRVV